MKADPLNRVFAKLIDVFLVLLISKLAGLVGLLAGALYILISDGLFEGQSLGKRLIGLRVVLVEQASAQLKSEFKDSAIRNAAFATLLLLSGIPLLGYLFAILLALYMGLELYFVLQDERGIRIGDIYASTQVQDARKD